MLNTGFIHVTLGEIFHSSDLFPSWEMDNDFRIVVGHCEKGIR